MSVTPVALDGDSHAVRIACSLACQGFRSIVIEVRRSRCRFWGNAIEVRSAGGRNGELPSRAVLRGGVLREMVNTLRDGGFGRAGEAVLYAAFRAHHWRRYWAALRSLAPPVDLYYVHSLECHRAIASIAAEVGAPLVYDAHDFYSGIEPPGAQRLFDRNRLRPFYDNLETQAMSAADAVVTVSNGVADQIERRFGRRSEVIRNCHDERYDRPCAADLRQVLGLAESDRLCVVIGNCKAGMAVEVAAAALACLPERFHLAFVGRGYEREAARFPHDLLGHRLHIGHVFPPDQIVPAVRSADIGLVLYEPRSLNYRCALPNGFFQTLAAGLPLVRAPLSEIENLIGRRAVGLLLDRMDAATLATAILDCKREAKWWGAEAAALAAELSWRLEAGRLEDLIVRSVTGKRPRLYQPVENGRAAAWQ